MKRTNFARMFLAMILSLFVGCHLNLVPEAATQSDVLPVDRWQVTVVNPEAHLASFVGTTVRMSVRVMTDMEFSFRHDAAAEAEAQEIEGSARLPPAAVSNPYRNDLLGRCTVNLENGMICRMYGPAPYAAPTANRQSTHWTWPTVHVSLHAARSDEFIPIDLALCSAVAQTIRLTMGGRAVTLTAAPPSVQNMEDDTCVYIARIDMPRQIWTRTDTTHRFWANGYHSWDACF